MPGCIFVVIYNETLRRSASTRMHEQPALKESILKTGEPGFVRYKCTQGPNLCDPIRLEVGS